MEKRYVSYKHQNFIDIGDELFKLAITLSYAEKSGRTFVLDKDDYMNIVDLFTKLSYEKLSIDDFTTKNGFNYHINYDDKKLLIDYEDYKFNYHQISAKTRVLPRCWSLCFLWIASGWLRFWFHPAEFPLIQAPSRIGVPRWVFSW